MAETAMPNTFTKEQIEAFLDRYAGMEEEASSIMGEAMSKCKNGPRQDQRDLREEMKGAGIRMKTFNALWAVRKAEMKAEGTVSDLEDDDRDQLIELAGQLEGTPFGDHVRSLIDAGN